MISCMGGWCTRRDKCLYYTLPSANHVERLCEDDSYDAFIPRVPPSQPDRVAGVYRVYQIKRESDGRCRDTPALNRHHRRDKEE